MKTKKRKTKKTQSLSQGCPMHGRASEPTIYGQSDLSYNDYLKIPEILSLQKPQSNPAHHDELLFIIIHQSYELWFKLILHEMQTAMNHLARQEALKAHHFIKRIVDIMNLLVQQIHILETMTPVDFLAFRDRLKPASGFQSIQFREVEFLAGLKNEKYINFFENRPELAAILKQRLKESDLRQEYFKMLKRLGFKVALGPSEGDFQSRVSALVSLYQKPGDHLPLYLLSEALVDLDENLGLWREHHVRVVERIIGFKQGTGGSAGVEYLRTTTAKKCFPELWEVRNRL